MPYWAEAHKVPAVDTFSDRRLASMTARVDCVAPGMRPVVAMDTIVHSDSCLTHHTTVVTHNYLPAGMPEQQTQGYGEEDVAVQYMVAEDRNDVVVAAAEEDDMVAVRVIVERLGSQNRNEGPVDEEAEKKAGTESWSLGWYTMSVQMGDWVEDTVADTMAPDNAEGSADGTEARDGVCTRHWAGAMEGHMMLVAGNWVSANRRRTAAAAGNTLSKAGTVGEFR